MIKINVPESMIIAAQSDIVLSFYNLAEQQKRQIKLLAQIADVSEEVAHQTLSDIAGTTPYSFISSAAFNLALNRISADKMKRFCETNQGKMHMENHFWWNWFDAVECETCQAVADKDGIYYVCTKCGWISNQYGE